jgi:uncharacterized protein
VIARRRWLAASAASATLLAAGCRTSPPTRWYALPSAWDEVAATHAPAAEVWELSSRIDFPGALDRDTLQLARGDTGLQPLAGHRWAEPLRDALPRVLLHDLQRLRGADRVWAAPAPPGVVPARRLHVALQALQGDAAHRELLCDARWWWVALPADAPPRTGAARFTVASADDSVDALVAAHRRALWQLAQRIAA